MRTLNLVTLVLILICSGRGEAVEKSTALLLRVNFGEKNTVFEIPDSKKVDLVVNGRKRKALRGNIDHAIKLATAASKEKSNDKSLCSRKYIELVFTPKGGKETRTYGCIDSKTPAAVKLSELSNLMLFM